MLERLRRLLEPQPVAPVADDELARVAQVVLLLEAAWSDETVQPEEQALLRDLLQRRFGLDAAGSEALLAEAERRRRAGHDHFSFTRLLNDRLDHAARLAVLEDLWRIVYADGVLDAHEDALLHKFARLLEIPHRELIALKLRVRDGE